MKRGFSDDVLIDEDAVIPARSSHNLHSVSGLGRMHTTGEEFAWESKENEELSQDIHSNVDNINIPVVLPRNSDGE